MKLVQYEVDEAVAVLTLDRPEKANAQTTAMLDELDEYWQAAAADPAVRVILVQANGRHFSAGMDLSPGTAMASPSAPASGQAFHSPVSVRYFGKVLSWRNVPKPSIAAVQGRCVAAGLMLCWPCDLILASEDAQFSDPTMRMGLAGVEYMAHMWEFGPRRAKEMLLRSTPISAEEAAALGMVNKVVPGDQLRQEAMAWAREIAALHPGMAAVVKRAINGAQDVQGFAAAVAQGFDLQEVVAALQPAAHGSGPAPESSVLAEMRRVNGGD